MVVAVLIVDGYFTVLLAIPDGCILFEHISIRLTLSFILCMCISYVSCHPGSMANIVSEFFFFKSAFVQLVMKETPIK